MLSKKILYYLVFIKKKILFLFLCVFSSSSSNVQKYMRLMNLNFEKFNYTAARHFVK
jgi:hypothetical protein